MNQLRIPITPSIVMSPLTVVWLSEVLESSEVGTKQLVAMVVWMMVAMEVNVGHKLTVVVVEVGNELMVTIVVTYEGMVIAVVYRQNAHK